ncbi:c-type heme family protein [Natranaerofaba carboxydovora]|uniref:ATP-binding protein n=1 Tax=Natranaerofaba carboxydovora TaxID=2742683 RepID=UPI001F14166A|nr:DUF3365 domain-containing protein [Natranaerofaba carboxydovora]UMZ73769.1 Signal transduction histidine-protein kinase BarA [Natranaerofaba carboxydovora]
MKRIKRPLIKTFVFYLVIIVIIINGLYLAWTLNNQKEQALNDMREKSEIISKQFLSMRRFMAINQDKINYDSDGNFEFKGLNPAAVGQGVSAIFDEKTDYGIKQAAVDARNPNNEADEFEKNKLKILEDNSKKEEIYSETEVNGEPYFRYLKPLHIETSCLECHGNPKGEKDIAGFEREGYEQGDLAGALSIKVPMKSFYDNLTSTYLSYSVFTLILVSALIFGVYGLMRFLIDDPLRNLTNEVMKFGEGDFRKKQNKFIDVNAMGEIALLTDEFNNMARKLSELYENLEDKVQERTAELRKLNKKLKDNNRLKSEFLANMSHELKTPLTSIIACCELMQEDEEERLTKEDKENLQDIRESADKLLTMITDILDFSKAEAGTLELNKELTDINRLIYDCERELRPWAKQKEITLDVNLKDEKSLIYCDPVKIRQILENLLSNAIKFTPNGGTISMGTKQKDKHVEIFVEDNGEGISTQEQEKIFEKFTQLDGSTTRRYKGTGLGLSLVKELVELHGGKINLVSSPEWGSRFTINLPLEEE